MRRSKKRKDSGMMEDFWLETVFGADGAFTEVKI